MSSQIRLSDLTSQNICDFATATVVKNPTWNFQQLIGASASTKRTSWNFEFGDLRSGQFCDLAIIRQVENVQPFFFYSQSTRVSCLSRDCLKIVSRQTTLEDPFVCLPQGHSLKVIRGYMLFSSSFWYNSEFFIWYVVGLVQTGFFCRHESTGMQLPYLGYQVTYRDLDLRSSFDIDFLCQNAYISKRLEKRNTMASESFHQFFLAQKLLSEDCLVKNVHFDISWPLQPNTWRLGQFWRPEIMHMRSWARVYVGRYLNPTINGLPPLSPTPHYPRPGA